MAESERPSEQASGEGSLKPNQVRLVPYLPDDTPVIYADGLGIFTGNGVWNLSFLQAETPVMPGIKVESIPSRCIVRIIVSEERMVEFLEVIRITGIRRGMIADASPAELAELEAEDGPNA